MIVTCEKIKLCIRWIATAKETPWQFSIWPQKLLVWNEIQHHQHIGVKWKSNKLLHVKSDFCQELKKMQWQILFVKKKTKSKKFKKGIDIRNWKEKIRKKELKRTFGTGFIPKGQKISKANCIVIISSKTINFCPIRHLGHNWVSFLVCLFGRNENKFICFWYFLSFTQWEYFKFHFLRTEDKGKKLAELDVLSPYPVLIGLQLGDLTVHLQLGWGCRKKRKIMAVITAKPKRNHAHRFDTPHRISAVDYW